MSKLCKPVMEARWKQVASPAQDHHLQGRGSEPEMPTDAERDERETDWTLATLAHLKAKRDRKKFVDLIALVDRLIAEEAAIVNAIAEAADKKQTLVWGGCTAVVVIDGCGGEGQAEMK
jgi:hypothetical protein